MNGFSAARASVRFWILTCDGAPVDRGVLLVRDGKIAQGLLDSGLLDSGLLDSGLLDSGVLDSGVLDSARAV